MYVCLFTFILPVVADLGVVSRSPISSVNDFFFCALVADTVIFISLGVRVKNTEENTPDVMAGNNNNKKLPRKLCSTLII